MLVTFDDADSSLEYSGYWSTAGDPQFDHAGTSHYTSDPNARVTLRFYGTAVVVYGTVVAESLGGRPKTRYTLDGSLDVQTYTAAPSQSTAKYNQQFYQSPQLDNGTHELIVTSLLANTTLYIDYLVVSLSPTPPTPPLHARDSDPMNSSTTSDQQQTGDTSSKPVPIGAIIGGVFGGIALILVIIIIILIRAPRRRDSRDPQQHRNKSSTRLRTGSPSLWERLLPGNRSPVVTPFELTSPSDPSLYTMTVPTLAGTSHTAGSAGVSGVGQSVTTSSNSSSGSRTLRQQQQQQQQPFLPHHRQHSSSFSNTHTHTRSQSQQYLVQPQPPSKASAASERRRPRWADAVQQQQHHHQHQRSTSSTTTNAQQQQQQPSHQNQQRRDHQQHRHRSTSQQTQWSQQYSQAYSQTGQQQQRGNGGAGRGAGTIGRNNSMTSGVVSNPGLVLPMDEEATYTAAAPSTVDWGDVYDTMPPGYRSPQQPLTPNR